MSERWYTIGNMDGMGDAYGLGPRIVLLAVFDCHHNVPPLGNGYNPRGGIGVEFAQVCTNNENILFGLEAVDGVVGGCTYTA